MMSFYILDNYLSLVLIVSLNAILIAGIEPELKLVNVVFRHGDRTPEDNGLEMFPNDPYVNYSFFPTGHGKLTNNSNNDLTVCNNDINEITNSLSPKPGTSDLSEDIQETSKNISSKKRSRESNNPNVTRGEEGKKREYELGQALRSRYKDFLGDLYLPKLVVAHSSDYDRTKMSLQLVLAALFPPTDIRQRWNADLNWQPIPATYVPRVDDNFFMGNECPQFLDEYNRILNLPEIKKEVSQLLKDITSKLSELTGKKIETALDLYYLYQTFVSESYLNPTLPKWAYDYFRLLDGPLFDGTVLIYNIISFTPLIRRLFTGPIIRAILDNMIAAKNPNPPDTKIYLYSGHDSNIASLLQVFGLYEPHAPKYSSAIIMELQELNQEYYVKLFYYQGIPPTIKELQISGCDVLCPFDKYLDLIEDLIPSDDEMICDKRQTPAFADTKYPADLQRITYNLIKTSAINRNA